MTEQIKKGLSCAAFGFLFVLVNFNLNLNNLSVNVTPDFIGWILFFLAFDRLGKYTADKKYLKWMSLLQVILTGAYWVLSIARASSDGAAQAADILRTITTMIATVYFFIFFGSLVDLARDFNSPRADTLYFLRYFNLIVDLALFMVSLFFILTGTVSATITLIFGVAALVAAIATAVVLFRLRNDVRQAQA